MSKPNTDNDRAQTARERAHARYVARQAERRATLDRRAERRAKWGRA